MNDSLRWAISRLIGDFYVTGTVNPNDVEILRETIEAEAGA